MDGTDATNRPRRPARLVAVGPVTSGLLAGGMLAGANIASGASTSSSGASTTAASSGRPDLATKRHGPGETLLTSLPPAR